MRRHRALNADGAANRIDRTSELHKNAVACGLYDAAAMFDDLWVHEGLTQSFERIEGPFLIAHHQPAVAYYVSCEDRRQPPFDPRFGHKSCPAAL
jgi:hypothetical protein